MTLLLSCAMGLAESVRGVGLTTTRWRDIADEQLLDDGLTAIAGFPKADMG